MFFSNSSPRKSRRLLTAFSILAAVTLACNLPFISTPVPSPEATTPTAAPKSAVKEPLPPVVVETSPLPAAVLPATGAVSLTFDQPMDRESVEAAVKVDPAIPGRFEWPEDDTVRFVPDQPLAPETQLTLTVTDTARSKKGLNLLRTASFSFQTAGALTAVERLPQPGTGDANPTSTVAVTFNQPVSQLGESDAPAAFTLEPAVDGRGYWLNTSTYVFEPDPAMGGGILYKVTLNPDLTSLNGARLEDAPSVDWSFTTAPPALIEVIPAAATTVMLDEQFQLTFNQPMDTASVEQNFTLRDAAGNLVSGEFTWTDRGRIVTFQPDELLRRGNSYFLQLSRQASSRGGTELLLSSRMEYRSAGEFGVSSTQPALGSPLQLYASFGAIVLGFTTPLAEGQDLSRLVNIEPEPGNLSIISQTDRKSLYLSGSFLEGTNYHVTLEPDLQDKWGGTLGESYSANFLASDSTPNLNIPIWVSPDHMLFARPGDSTLPAYATNLSTLEIARVKLSLQQFLDSVYKYDLPTVDNFPSPERWTQSLNLPRNISQGIDINLTPGDTAMQEGLYIYTVDSPELPGRVTGYSFGLVTSNIQITVKEGQDEVFLWVTNLATGQPVAGSAVQIYNSAGDPAAVGTTSTDGTARISLQKKRDNYSGLVVVVGTPGGADYSVGVSSWYSGIAPYTLGVAYTSFEPALKGYLYTDRPIYRPGQTVYFRAVLRVPDDARYSLPDFDSATFQLYGPEIDYSGGEPPLLDTVQLELSPYGTVSGEFTLSDDAKPGYYRIQMEKQNPMLEFQVAEYRKPEINVQVNFAEADYLAGSGVQAQVEAEYYFGGAVSDAKVRWTLYQDDKTFSIPGGYTTGLVDTSWMNPSWYGWMGMYGSKYITSGEGQTDADGKLKLTFTAADLEQWLTLSEAHTLSLQAEVVDETGMTVSERGSTALHPDDFYIGIQPESWIATAGTSLGFTIQTTDWAAQAAGNKDLSAVFQKVEWVQDWSNVQTGVVTYKEQLTEIGSVNFRTDASGQARIEFNVDQPGTYQLEVKGGRAVSQVLVWAGGQGSVPWPKLPDQHLKLQADQETYKTGDTTAILITNPFPGGAKALVTLERRNVRHYQVLDISGASETVIFDLGADDAPNVFATVVLLGQTDTGKPDFRVGMLKINVDPEALLLDVEVKFEDTTLEPGQTARASVLVRDAAGNPVQGEFSMAVVDKSIFALAKPNARDIVTEFYGQQPLGVITSMPLSGYTQRMMTVKPATGGGGGGGERAPAVDLRENFRDTAYWTGSFETDETGQAAIAFPMPDNLTTWVVTVRGLTRDAKVGEAATELLVTRDLIIRPVTPRFMVAGDRVQLGAVINNNTGQNLDVAVELDAVGVALSEANAAQMVQVPAGGRERVNWWVEVEDAGAARLVFSAKSGAFQDSSTPVMGDIPILRYSAPQTFGTSGLMTAAGENLEVVSLPKSYQPTGGELRVEMNSSLAGTVLSDLKVMDTYPLDFVEPIISHLLANLTGYNLLKESGSDQPDLLAGYQKAIRKDLDRLPALQNSNGGFGWSQNNKSDLYLTSYALLVLAWAQDAGYMVPPNLIPKTREYLSLNAGTPVSTMEDWQLDRLALADYAMFQAGGSDIHPEELFRFRDRLSPWAQALLALSLVAHDTSMADSLLSDLQGLAVRSASGVNWQSAADDYHNYATPNFNTAVVVYAISAKDPASPLLADAVRYLVSHRRASGGWWSSYDTAWTFTALTQFVRGTSELKGNFDYSAVLNGAPLASGSASSTQPWTLVKASVPVSELDQNAGNALRFIRGEGTGRLYYRAFLEVGQPAEDAQPLDRGLTVSRDYILAGADCLQKECPPVDSVSLQAKNPVVIGRVTITNPKDRYYVVVEDFIPAGAELINLNLETSSVYFENPTEDPNFDPMNPFANGWGWWWFDSPTIYDDHIRWIADYLPAGTYTLTYRLQPQLAGEFRVLPARAYAYYFPEVEGRSAGAVFSIKE